MKRLSVKIYHFSFINLSRFFIFSFLFLLASNCPHSSVYAQENEQRDAAPPPLKIVSKDERKQLEAETDVKKRTKLSLQLIEARLVNAENFNSQKQFAEMFAELGSFHALVDNILDFLNRNDNGKGKVLDNFKRVEINLRLFLPRIELIRRDLPDKYEPYIRDLVKQTRKAREKAVEPLFSNTIVPDNDN